MHQLTRSIVALSLSALLWSPAAFAEDRVRDGDLVAITGDSITQARKYSALIETYLLVCKPAQNTQVFVSGWSGQTANDFNKRVANDVARFKPAVVTTSFGMNDGRYTAFSEANAEAFATATREYVRQLKAAGVRFLVLGSPGSVDSHDFVRTKPEIYNDTLKRLGNVARTIAQEEGVAHVDVHTPMFEAMTQAKARFGDTYSFIGKDGFHPDWSGHHIMAYAYLKALVGRHEIGEIRHDFTTGATSVTEGHRVLSAAGGEIEIESTTFPYCFFGAPDDPAGTRSAASWANFNDEFNRFMLVVDNAPPRARVTWGDASHEFTHEQLAAGINLAEEFLDTNPFEPTFSRVLSAVVAKQTFETHMVKAYIAHLPVLEKVMPAEADTFAHLRDSFAARREGLIVEALAAAAPVRHSLRIESSTASDRQP